VFRVLLDGRLATEVTAEHGQPRTLRVDVTDALQLTLQSFRPGTTEHPMLAGVFAVSGRSNQLPELAWGNPTVHA
jgi:hypothetical protein